MNLVEYEDEVTTHLPESAKSSEKIILPVENGSFHEAKAPHRYTWFAVKETYATSNQLWEWYRFHDGEAVIEKCMRAKSFKRAWTEYATKFNNQNYTRLWYLLCTTVDGVIRKFGVKKCNEINFRLLLSWQVQDISTLEEWAIVVTPERLCEWYRWDGKEIIEACKSSSDFPETWKTLSLEYNIRHGLELGWYLPTTINGVILVFWWGKASPVNMVKLLSGKIVNETEKLAQKRRLYGTPQQLRHWYKQGGKEAVDVCRRASSFDAAWRKFADLFNTKECFDYGFRIPNNKVGLVNALGGNGSYTIADAVRLFEELPEGTLVPDLKEKTKKAAHIVLDEHDLLRRKEEREAIALARRNAHEQEKREKKEAREKKRLAKKEVSSRPHSKIKTLGGSIFVAEKSKESVDEILESADMSSFMTEFQERFPYFLHIHKRFYAPLRQFIRLLERVYPDERKINHEDMDIQIVGNTMFLQIKEAYVCEHSPWVISNCFYDAYKWYLALPDKTQNKKVTMDLHSNLPKET